MITIKEVLQAMKDGHIVSDQFMYNQKPYRFFKRLKNDPKNARVPIKDEPLHINDIIDMSETYDIYINVSGYVTEYRDTFNYCFGNPALKLRESHFFRMKFSFYQWMQENPDSMPCFLYFNIRDNDPYTVKEYDTSTVNFQLPGKPNFQIVHIDRPCDSHLKNYINYLKLKGIGDVYIVAHYLHVSQVGQFMTYLDTICSMLGSEFSNEPY